MVVRPREHGRTGRSCSRRTFAAGGREHLRPCDCATSSLFGTVPRLVLLPPLCTVAPHRGTGSQQHGRQLYMGPVPVAQFVDGRLWIVGPDPEWKPLASPGAIFRNVFPGLAWAFGHRSCGGFGIDGRVSGGGGESCGFLRRESFGFCGGFFWFWNGFPPAGPPEGADGQGLPKGFGFGVQVELHGTGATVLALSLDA